MEGSAPADQPQTLRPFYLDAGSASMYAIFR